MRKGGGTEVPREQCTHTGISAPRIIPQKSSSCPPNVIGDRAGSHPRVPVLNIFPLSLMSCVPSIFVRNRLTVAYLMATDNLIPVRKEHCSFEVLPHTTNQWSTLKGAFSFISNSFPWRFPIPMGILSSPPLIPGFRYFLLCVLMNPITQISYEYLMTKHDFFCPFM